MHFVRRTTLGWTISTLSLLPLPLVWLAYIRHSDRFAVFSVPPIWFWSGLGFFAAALAACILRKQIAAIPLILWIAFTFAYTDEAKVLRNVGKPLLQPGHPAPHQGKPVFRVLTMNCAIFEYGNPSHDIARWYPDIVLLQDTLPHQVQAIAQRLYGSHAYFATYGGTNGIASRWPILRQTNHPVLRNQQATLQLPDQSQVEIVNLHLQSASTDLRIWHRSTWADHRVHRAHRMNEIHGMLQVLEQTTAYPMSPVLLGGDFNAPATDAAHRLLSPNFKDSFLEAGRGWGNSYHRRFPILRIDALYHTFHFTAVRARTIESAHSDHRMVIADYIRNGSAPAWIVGSLDRTPTPSPNPQ